MLRFLENGIPVRIVLTTAETHAVDTEADLARVEELMVADLWMSEGVGRLS
jgi:CMP-2-keto-3-deoxyoctulosonic acid synthetase